MEGDTLPPVPPAYALARFVSESSTVGLVAFSAYDTVSRYYDQYEAVVFDGNFTNFGGGYDPVSSMFTCPVSGVYVVSVTFTTYDERYAYGSITHEGMVLHGAYADDGARTRSSAATVSVFECTAGDRVWVRTGASTSHRTHGGADYLDNTSGFSGFLLYAL